MNKKSTGNNAGKFWIFIGLVIAVFGVGMMMMTNNINEKNIEKLTQQCESEGGKATVKKDVGFLSTSYEFDCKKISD